MNTLVKVISWWLIIIPVLINSCKKEEVPTLATSSVTNITGTAATSGGTIFSQGSSVITSFGVCWSNNSSPTIADNKTVEGNGGSSFPGLNTFISNISEMNEATVYFVRAYATNSTGTGYGNAVSFTTQGLVPVAFTNAPINLTQNSATLIGIVNPNWITTTVTFEYGTSVNYGSVVTATQSPLTGNINTNTSVNISGLIAGVTYHYRVKAVNSLGTSYGEDAQFITPLPVKDADGNEYKTVVIGSQTWMAENLRTTRYLNGDLIGTTTPATFHLNALSTPKYQWAYDGNENNVTIYGRLYTWFAIMDNRKVCPSGWHVPTDSEWTTLINGFGGRFVAGGKLKETGTTHWESTSEEVTNESGFTLLPGGQRFFDGSFSYIGFLGFWWTSTESPESIGTDGVLCSKTWYEDSGINIFTSASPSCSGNSVRCIKD